LAVGRARHAETGELATLYSSSTGKIEGELINEFLDSAAGEIAVNVNSVKNHADGFGIINGIHQSHAELNMIYWAQKEGYIIEGIGVSHNAGVCYHCSDDLWEIAGEKDIHEEKIAYLINKANQIFLEDNDNDNYDDEVRQGYYVYFGEQACNTSKLLLSYISQGEIGTYLKIFVKIIFIIYEYLDMYFANVYPDWGHKTPKDEGQRMMMNSSLMQDELHKESADLEFLKNTPELTPEILSTFRENSCPNGLGVLGSLDTVRVNLEGI
jgi:hypothetical protein